MNAACLINRCPSTTLRMKPLEEVWSRHPSNIDKIRLFGCVAYAYIRQDKVKLRALRFMFLGYPEEVKGYRFWCLDPCHRRCITSQDVVLNEAEMVFKKANNDGRNAKISEEGLEYEEIHVKVEHSDVELHNPCEVRE